MNELPISLIDLHEFGGGVRSTNRCVTYDAITSFSLKSLTQLTLSKHRQLEPLRLLDHVSDQLLLLRLILRVSEKLHEARPLTLHLLEKLRFLWKFGADLIHFGRDLLIKDVGKGL